MSNTTLERIEADITALALTDQLRLMELLAAHIQHRTDTKWLGFDSSLAAMAHDPEIQKELQKINAEFSSAEADDLKIDLRIGKFTNEFVKR